MVDPTSRLNISQQENYSLIELSKLIGFRLTFILKLKVQIINFLSSYYLFAVQQANRPPVQLQKNNTPYFNENRDTAVSSENINN